MIFDFFDFLIFLFFYFSIFLFFYFDFFDFRKTDLGLHCKTPGGEHISWRQRSADGVTLDVDANGSGDTPVDNPVENIYVEAPQSGTYVFEVNNFTERATPTPFTVRLKEGNAPWRDLHFDDIAHGATIEVFKVNWDGSKVRFGAVDMNWDGVKSKVQSSAVDAQGVPPKTPESDPKPYQT